MCRKHIEMLLFLNQACFGTLVVWNMTILVSQHWGFTVHHEMKCSLSVTDSNKNLTEGGSISCDNFYISVVFSHGKGPTDRILFYYYIHCTSYIFQDLYQKHTSYHHCVINAQFFEVVHLFRIFIIQRTDLKWRNSRKQINTQPSTWSVHMELSTLLKAQLDASIRAVASNTLSYNVALTSYGRGWTDKTGSWPLIIQLVR